MERIDGLLSLPPASVQAFDAWADDSRPFFVTSDPPGCQLGSGGGTAFLLYDAWQSQAPELTFEAWLAESRKLLIHGSGQSRRLPAYAPEGKPLLPLPIFDEATGQRPDQCLVDLQMGTYQRLFRHAPSTYRVAVTCGDVLLTNDAWTPTYPDVDVLIVGLKASPEEAQRHGVMFCAETSHDLAFFLQKPDPERIRNLAGSHAYYLDTGVWLLSDRALAVLMAKCGWSIDDQQFADKLPGAYELFDRFGTSLGHSPAEQDKAIGSLTCAVLPLPNGRFYHFGTNRSVMASVAQLSSPAENRRSFGHGSAELPGRPILIHADVATPLNDDQRHIWIENSVLPSSWTLTGDHVITGVPPNTWSVSLSPGTCLDVCPVAEPEGLALRTYGFDDVFRGALGDPATCWFGRPVEQWLAERWLTLEDAGLDAHEDIQYARLFPVIPPDEDASAMIAWLTSSTRERNDVVRNRWIKARRVSATDLVQSARLAPRCAQRTQLLGAALARTAPEEWHARCRSLDLEICGRLARDAGVPFPAETSADVPSLADVHDAMFRARAHSRPELEAIAFKRLRDLLIGRMELDPVVPSRDVLDDQIVWGRSPIRLDLAGGWTDTPPYCLEHGGRVVNVAVNLNGQPPIQVFARVCETPHIVLRSIDLGIDETIATYDDLSDPKGLGSGFSIPRAALRLVGFDPRFHADGGAESLKQQLTREFGGGIELTMLAAIPKGSGLGTSSVLAATLLGTLGELCGLHWSNQDLFARTMVLEQILTSGGGWQDQVGGIVPGLKLVKTTAGLAQNPTVRWLPSSLFREATTESRILLYYTGITRVAHNILGEIVRGIFLNDARRLSILEDIGYAADFAADVIQKRSWEGLCEAVRRSWSLNQALDRGTNPPTVQAILHAIKPWSAGHKLLGAGGGGYLMILANSETDGHRIRHALAEHPPNPRARFVDVSLSESGLQITRS